MTFNMSRSHPVWVRGLKQELVSYSIRISRVAPRVGAWIETLNNQRILAEQSVAPRVGAWIETHYPMD